MSAENVTPTKYALAFPSLATFKHPSRPIRRNRSRTSYSTPRPLAAPNRCADREGEFERHSPCSVDQLRSWFHTQRAALAIRGYTAGVIIGGTTKGLAGQNLTAVRGDLEKEPIARTGNRGRHSVKSLDVVCPRQWPRPGHRCVRHWRRRRRCHRDTCQREAQNHWD